MSNIEKARVCDVYRVCVTNPVENYIKTRPDGSRYIDHPIYSVCHFEPQLIFQYRDTFKLMCRAYLNLIDRENFAQAIMMHQKHYKLDALLRYQDKLRDPDFWAIIRSCWMGLKDIHPYISQLEELFHLDRGAGGFFMGTKELDRYASMPNKITVYRGYSEEKGFTGLSWTLSQHTAYAYSKRRRNPLIAKATVHLSDVAGVILCRDENEVVVTSRMAVRDAEPISHKKSFHFS